jgi:hypothetical protein
MRPPGLVVLLGVLFSSSMGVFSTSVHATERVLEGNGTNICDNPQEELCGGICTFVGYNAATGQTVRCCGGMSTCNTGGGSTAAW